MTLFIGKSHLLIVRLKTTKNFEVEEEAIVKDADNIGLITETYKQYDCFLRKKTKPELDTRLPFNPANNIVILPL